MPTQVEIDGKQVTVYTEEEHKSLLEAAKQEASAKALEGMLTKEDAERLADTKAAAARPPSGGSRAPGCRAMPRYAMLPRPLPHR